MIGFEGNLDVYKFPINKHPTGLSTVAMAETGGGVALLGANMSTYELWLGNSGWLFKYWIEIILTIKITSDELNQNYG